MTTEAIPIQERVSVLEESHRHLATREDLERLRADMNTQMAELRADVRVAIGEQRADTNTKIEELRADVNIQIQAQRADFQAALEQQRTEFLVALESYHVRNTRWMIGTILASAGLALSIALAVQNFF